MCVFCCSSSKLHTLMHALSPAILRVGGSTADWQFYDKPLSIIQAADLRPSPAVITSMLMILQHFHLFNLSDYVSESGGQILVIENLTSHPCQLNLAIPPWVGASEYWRWSFGHYQGTKRRVLSDSRPCNQDCWHNGMVR